MATAFDSFGVNYLLRDREETSSFLQNEWNDAMSRVEEDVVARFLDGEPVAFSAPVWDMDDSFHLSVDSTAWTGAAPSTAQFYESVQPSAGAKRPRDYEEEEYDHPSFCLEIDFETQPISDRPDVAAPAEATQKPQGWVRSLRKRIRQAKMAARRRMAPPAPAATEPEELPSLDVQALESFPVEQDTLEEEVTPRDIQTLESFPVEQEVTLEEEVLSSGTLGETPLPSETLSSTPLDMVNWDDLFAAVAIEPPEDPLIVRCMEVLKVSATVAAQRISDTLRAHAYFCTSEDPQCPAIYMYAQLLHKFTAQRPALYTMWPSTDGTMPPRCAPTQPGGVLVEYRTYAIECRVVPRDKYIHALLDATVARMRVRGCAPLEALHGIPRSKEISEIAFGNVCAMKKISAKEGEQHGIPVPRGSVAKRFAVSWPAMTLSWMQRQFKNTHAALRPAIEMRLLENEIVWVGPRVEHLKAQAILFGIAAQKASRWACKKRPASSKYTVPQPKHLALDVAGVAAAICEIALRENQPALFVLGVWVSLCTFLHGSPSLNSAVDLVAAHAHLRGCRTVQQIIESLWIFRGAVRDKLNVATRAHACQSVCMSSRFTFASMDFLLDMNELICSDTQCACHCRPGKVAFDEKREDEIVLFDSATMASAVVYILIHDFRASNKKAETSDDGAPAPIIKTVQL